jgi:thiol-disulfide isomerase/thioredoxin
MFFNIKSYLYFILLLYKIICGYSDALYVKEYTDVNEMVKKIESDNKTAFFLIYSDLCPHCLIFEPYYIKLSEEYHERVKFYVMDLYTNWDDKFDIKGTPTLFIYYNGKFKEYQGKRKYEVLKELLENELLRSCKDLEYEKIDEFKEKFNNNKNESNYVIGYFKNEEDMNNFKNLIKNFLEDIDYCYIVNVFPQNVIEKNIEIMSKQQGKNSFDEFIFEGFNEQTNLDFEIFIKENIFNIFYEIDNKENLNYFKKNDRKNFFIFVYETEDEKNI